MDPRETVVAGLRSKGLSQKQLARLLGVSEQTIYTWFHHEKQRRLPTQRMLQRIFAAFPDLLPLYLRELIGGRNDR